jgi:glutamate-5-semialdehyde dehydrogenase
MTELELKGQKAKHSARFLNKVGANEKNEVLINCAEALVENADFILENNEKDLAKAQENGVKGALLDRLKLTYERIKDMANGLLQIAQLEDPIGEIVSMKTRPNGLIIGKMRVPMGVIGIIYEARPNVTADAFGLCLKSGNATILRGGKEAIHSNSAIVKVLQNAIVQNGFPIECVQLVEDTTRESAVEMMRLNKYLDLLIPRGGAGLIQTVVQNSTVPVIETGVGNCHIFVDKDADFDKAIAITLNAKTQRPGVCNAAETLLVHKEVAQEFLPLIAARLHEKKVEMRACSETLKFVPQAIPATETDWDTEYLDLILAMKVVNDADQAMEHIHKHSTMHSEAIVTENYTTAQRFLKEIDAAAVYVNASTRFTDGEEFGFGAEIGISTQKLHARGPMGLIEMTSTKYIIYGNGHVR